MPTLSRQTAHTIDLTKVDNPGKYDTRYNDPDRIRKAITLQTKPTNNGETDPIVCDLADRMRANAEKLRAEHGDDPFGGLTQ